ncbi:MAG: hypothetical protein JW986_06790 [Methanotrichaceae archaeon]|nr:hypothetical protein [Methanotrichaceae archaeon]
MRPALFALLALFILLAPASALFDSATMQNYIDRYNANIDNAPALLRSVVGDERVDVEILLVNGTIFKMGLETEGGRITGTVPGGVGNPSIVAETREDVIYRILRASDPIAEFQRSREAGDMVIEGMTFTAKLKLAAALSSMDILRFFLQLIRG